MYCSAHHLSVIYELSSMSGRVNYVQQSFYVPMQSKSAVLQYIAARLTPAHAFA